MVLEANNSEGTSHRARSQQTWKRNPRTRKSLSTTIDRKSGAEIQLRICGLPPHQKSPNHSGSHCWRGGVS
ncbi:hypothetical protein Y1Q_0001881 [Alligator mississippiensis]|uniref:Uncharacterized protein n=1 Tax=Alligator mississippiensis TaxID=8496 RepID=A0A151PGJ3_ALLMI|nr:hypothetical protein Y1Q_0001881 [Alligator mississippiensis]